jgi:hypothetical protein
VRDHLSCSHVIYCRRFFFCAEIQWERSAPTRDEVAALRRAGRDVPDLLERSWSLEPLFEVGNYGVMAVGDERGKINPDKFGDLLTCPICLDSLGTLHAATDTFPIVQVAGSFVFWYLCSSICDC